MSDNIALSCVPNIICFLDDSELFRWFAQELPAYFSDSTKHYYMIDVFRSFSYLIEKHSLHFSDNFMIIDSSRFSTRYKRLHYTRLYNYLLYNVNIVGRVSNEEIALAQTAVLPNFFLKLNIHNLWKGQIFFPAWGNAQSSVGQLYLKYYFKNAPTDDNYYLISNKVYKCLVSYYQKPMPVLYLITELWELFDTIVSNLKLSEFNIVNCQTIFFDIAECRFLNKKEFAMLLIRHMRLPKPILDSED